MFRPGLDLRGDLPRASPWERLPLWVRIVLPAVLILPPGLAATGAGPSALTTWNAALLLLLAVVAVVVRRRLPRIAVGMSAVLTVLGLAGVGPLVSLLLALLVTVFSLARHTSRVPALIMTLAATGVVGTATVVFVPSGWDDVRAPLQAVVMIAFAFAAGDGSRSHAAYIGAVIERARRAEETKESEARRRVAEERLTIARDLHDVMAHQIAVITMHANVASQALPDRPEDAQASLKTIREAGRTVLGEIASLLRVLRADDSTPDTGGGSTEPVPGLAQLPILVADFERSGLEVELRTVGTPVAVPQAVDIVAYRVTGEALTNALKHGDDGSALLQLEYGLEELEITVTNTAARSVRGPGGHGLVGAHERVTSVAGSLETSYGPGSVHRLTVRLPLGSTQ